MFPPWQDIVSDEFNLTLHEQGSERQFETLAYGDINVDGIKDQLDFGSAGVIYGCPAA